MAVTDVLEKHQSNTKRRLTKQLVILMAVFVMGVWLIVTHLRSLQVELVESSTIHSAGQYSQMLEEFRTLYSSEVVQRVASEGILVTHDYHQRKGAIPLPATLSMLLGERIGLHGKDLSAKLYSPYPFPWRQESNGLKDSFAKDAWEHFRSGEVDPYVKVENTGGVVRVRYAVADRMRDSCVSCHNSHPQSPKTDWQEGDVRGVLEVVLPITQGLAKVDQIFQEVGSLTVLLMVITFGCIALIIRRLQLQKERIELMNEQLGNEVNERKIAEEEATVAKEEAVAANQAKSVFLANITHEIRTPMNAILGYAQILERDAQLTQDQQESVSIINKSGGHLLGLINDVLELSRIEAGGHQLRAETFDLVALLSDLSQMFSLKATQKGISWQVENDFAFQKLPVVGDAGKLRQILINLVGNAIKFTDTGFVRLAVTNVRDNTYRFNIVDSGPGISEEHQTTVLEPFSQGQQGYEKGGTGLGLSISVKYLAMMGSQLELESELDKGTSVSFELELILSESLDLDSDSNRQVVALKPEYNANILVVDDIELNRQLLHRMLSDIGIKVITAASGEEALECLENYEFDLVFSDLVMPDMDGIALLKRVRQNPKWSELPFIAISASSLQAEAQYYIDIGFDDYISKPFYFESIYLCLQTHLQLEFVYKDQQSSVTDRQSTMDSMMSPQLKHSLYQAAELYQISELEEALKGYDSTQYGWVSEVQSFIAKYDMEGLMRYLEAVETKDV
ncbi:response regulator [Litoribrevibacter albus]|uniref:histidine kinase n=1 Tax=Litoribrevibacter albus TaxID=1473156 RepID=A0AA37SFV6_9GAMM|nr:response regulator [Litoribrevibacter albus]GLQ33454.1 hypothetical protein GCM10007876_39340 [Litoribrevibacter albus]